MAEEAPLSHRKSPTPVCTPSDGHRSDAHRRALPRAESLVSFYLRASRQAFRTTSWSDSPAILFVASALHAFGHAALALAAGRGAVVLAAAMTAGGDAALVATSSLRAALILGSIGFAAAVVKSVGGVVAAAGQARIASRVANTLRLDVLRGFFASYRLRRPRQPDHGQEATTPDVSMHRADSVPFGAAARGVTALTAQVEEVERGLEGGLLGGARAVLQLAPLLAVLIWISPRMAAVAVLVLAPFAVVLSRSRRAWKNVHADSLAHAEHLVEAADEAVRHADLWVAYSAEEKAKAVVAALGDAMGEARAKMHARAAMMSGANEVLAALALILALAAGSAGWLGDVGGGGRLLAFTVCFFLAYRPLRDLAEARIAWHRAEAAFASLALHAPLVEPDDAEGPTSNEAATSWPLARLQVERVALRHGTMQPVSFVLEPGEVAVVVGATGVGKTTLVRTLLGLELPRTGDIVYGTASLVTAPPGLDTRPFAWVPQTAALLADTLEANVRLAAPHASPTTADTLEALGADPLGDALTSERLGAGGVEVSGGERQWIALARALTTDQPVLLLDEPTSSLDPASQEAVLDALAALRGKRSILLVTHRTEPLALADVVVRIDDAGVSVTDGPMRRKSAPHERWAIA
jgi:ABC-type multidrug transport system fused ATPase/permease subunit